MFDAPCPTPDALWQDPAFVAALRLCGQKPIVLPSGLMLLRRRIMEVTWLMLPRAPPPPDLHRQLSQGGIQRLPLILSPDAPCTMPRALRLQRGRQVARLNLDADAQTRRAALHPKWRNQLRYAEKTPLQVQRRPLPPDPDHPVLRAEAQQSKQRGYANWPIPLTAAFAKAAPDQTHLFSAVLRGQAVAHMLFLTHASRASYHIGHITTAGRAHCAHNLLLWQAGEYLAAQGIIDMDLGVLHPRTAGLNRFKLRSGARACITGGTWLRYWPFS
jgi:Acetyltransferase (GNAT) domain